MRRIYNVDVLLLSGEFIILKYKNSNKENLCVVSDVLRGDRRRVKLRLYQACNNTLVLDQFFLDNETLKIYLITKETNPEYFL